MLGVLCPYCRAAQQSLARMTWRSIYTVSLGGDEVEVIRYPVGKQQKLLKAKEKKKTKGKLISIPRPGKLLISTNERKMNMYTNEFPTKFEPPTLASQTWTSRKSPGRHFTIHPTRENPSIVKEDEKETPKFQDLGISNLIVDAIAKLGIKNPTNIQRKVIPVVLEGENLMLAAETGSGKTYGYLLPIVERVMQMEKEMDVERDNGPSAIILTPSKELSSQVLRMSLDLNLPLNFVSLDEIWGTKKKNTARSAEILITTPVLALAALRGRVISLNNVRYAVVDECDTLLDESFGKYMCNILGRLNIKKGVSKPLLGEIETQLILCSATFPKYAERALEDVISISNLSSISTGYMHRISPHVTHKFLRVRPSEKFEALIHILQQSIETVELTMVFCNKKDTVHWLAKELLLHGIHVDKLHSGSPMQVRKSIIKQASTGSTGILICTDLSSRGIDTQRTGHVINYDFPNAASDYIHRSGRVGRMGQDISGKVTSLICRKWEIPLVMKIEEAARRRERIEGVNANIKSYHSERWEKKTQATSIEFEFEDDDDESDLL